MEKKARRGRAELGKAEMKDAKKMQTDDRKQMHEKNKKLLFV